MGTDFTTIVRVRQHFGNEENYLKDLEPGLPFMSRLPGGLATMSWVMARKRGSKMCNGKTAPGSSTQPGSGNKGTGCLSNVRSKRFIRVNSRDCPGKSPIGGYWKSF